MLIETGDRIYAAFPQRRLPANLIANQADLTLKNILIHPVIHRQPETGQMVRCTHRLFQCAVGTGKPAVPLIRASP
jgi:hypothetical protein